MTPTTPALDRALNLARISLTFARVERVTRHEDGVRPETDTDHTVMLGLVACDLAPAHLDRARIAAFALVHDLVEVYAGDTQTLVISPEGATAKRDREDIARARLVAELGDGSWLAGLLATYERQQEPEARFVRLLDKVLPKLTHAFNGCGAALVLTDRPGFIDAHARQFQKLREEYSEFPDALDLLWSSMLHAEGCWPSPEVRRTASALDAAPPAEGAVS
jgi:putative hydrolase of HD superfamily